MSSSLLVKHMQDAAVAKHLKYSIFATGVSSAPDKFARRHPSVLLIGPQVRFVYDRFCATFPIPVQVIDMHDYGVMDGPKVLHTAMALMGDLPSTEQSASTI